MDPRHARRSLAHEKHIWLEDTRVAWRAFREQKGRSWCRARHLEPRTLRELFVTCLIQRRLSSTSGRGVRARSHF